MYAKIRIFMKIFTILRTIFTYLIYFLVCLILVPPAMIILLLPEYYRYNNKFLFYIIYLLYKSILYLSFLPIKIHGQQNISKDTNYIFVANHSSALDIPMLGYVVTKGRLHTWLVLEKYASKPVLGFFIRRLFVTVNQQSAMNSGRSLIQILKFINAYPRDILLFPEGGRYLDEKVHDFFLGFVILVQKTGYPVIPVYLRNVGKAYPPFSFLIHNYKIMANIGAPMEKMNDESAQEFSDRVRNWFIKQSEL